MKFAKSTPRADKTIQGLVFSVPQPFTEGHTCTANEAAVLNQTLAENVRNNMASKVDKAKENGSTDNIQAEIDEYVTGYEFGVRKGGSIGPKDPVEREALAIAESKVKEALKAKGYSLKDVGTERIRELAKETIGKYPEITEQARQIVETRKSVGEEVLADIQV